MMSVLLVEGDNELNIQMIPLPPPVANLFGLVTDADTGNPLGSVKITIDSLIFYTASDGHYAITGLTPGSYNISFEKAGYETVVR